METLDIHTPEGAEAWGDVAGRRFVAQHASPPERDDAREAWRAACPETTAPEVFQTFARAFMGRAAAELAAEHADTRAELPDDERAELEHAVTDTLRVSREGRIIGQQEAARQALRASIRYGLDLHARRAAERLCEVQGSLSFARELRPLRVFVDIFEGDA
ncbi:MAG TPA: hypothetical protein VM694_38435 [Polyangium sp.]|jgi:hypothetical protein|nr:hypothetical protein [Polyangium sp.]